MAVCAPTDEQAWAQFADMEWFWNQWAIQFGQGMPMQLVGSPDTISRQIEEAQTTLGVEEAFFLVPQGHPFRRPDQRLGELISDKVMPRFA